MFLGLGSGAAVAAERTQARSPARKLCGKVSAPKYHNTTHITDSTSHAQPYPSCSSPCVFVQSRRSINLRRITTLRLKSATLDLSVCLISHNVSKIVPQLSVATVPTTLENTQSRGKFCWSGILPIFDVRIEVTGFESELQKTLWKVKPRSPLCLQ